MEQEEQQQSSSSSQQLLPPLSQSFHEIDKNVYRSVFFWKLPLTPPAPVETYLIEHEGEWTMIDAGHSDNAKAICQEVKNFLKDKKLSRVLITHGHLDHTGSLLELIEAYPDLRICAHADEIPFLEGRKYRSCKGESLTFNLAKYILEESIIKVPSKYLDAIQEGQEIGGIRVLCSPGHTPGSLSYIHEASGSLFCGDCFMNIPALKLFASKEPVLQGSLAFSTGNPKQAHESMVKIAEQNFTTLYPAHDMECGIKKERIVEFVKNKSS